MSLSLVIGVLLVLAAAAFVAAPFLLAAEGAMPDAFDRRARANRRGLEAQKTEAYAAIKEAEFDYRMGKLSDTDFEALREKYSRQAIEAIAALEEGSAADSRRPVSGRAAGARGAGSARVSRIAFCPSCGQSVPPRANFCPACGRSLREEEVA